MFEHRDQSWSEQVGPITSFEVFTSFVVFPSMQVPLPTKWSLPSKWWVHFDRSDLGLNHRSSEYIIFNGATDDAKVNCCATRWPLAPDYLIVQSISSGAQQVSPHSSVTRNSVHIPHIAQALSTISSSALCPLLAHSEGWFHVENNYMMNMYDCRWNNHWREW